MGLHRLLQRGFSKMFGYPLPSEARQAPQPLRVLMGGTDQLAQPEWNVLGLLEAQNMNDLHYKIKGVRSLTLILESFVICHLSVFIYPFVIKPYESYIIIYHCIISL